MKTEKCRILWIDDELCENTAIYDIYLASEKYAEKLDINIVQTVEDFKCKIKEKRYNAVIMDVNIITDSFDSNPCPLIFTINELCSDQIDNYNLQLYAFTGALNICSKSEKEIKDISIQLKQNFRKNPHTGRYFWDKEVGTDIFEDILNDYNERDYAGFDYILDFFANGWIDKKIKSQYLDPIMKYYSQKDYNSAHGNNMRNIVVPMLERFVTEYEKNPLYVGKLTKRGLHDSGRPSDIINNLPNIDTSFEFITGPLLHMIKATNKQSHGPTDDEERQLFFESDFSTFFLVCKWFYKKMRLFYPQQNCYTSQQSEKTLPVNTTSDFRGKENNSIPVRVYKNENNRYKLDIDVELPSFLRKENPSFVHVRSVIPDKNNPRIWFADIDRNKPFDIDKDRLHTAT